MLGKLLLLFTVVPLVELALLIYVGSIISFWPTIGIVLATALLGALLTKFEGLRAWRKINEDLQSMQLPADSLLDGLAVLIAGVLLITPGVLTDVFAIVLLIPPLRRPIRAYAKKRFSGAMNTGSISFLTADQGASPFDPFQGRSPFGSPFERHGDGEEVIDVTPGSEAKRGDDRW